MGNYENQSNNTPLLCGMRDLWEPVGSLTLHYGMGELWEPVENLTLRYGMEELWEPVENLAITLWHEGITRTSRKPHHYIMTWGNYKNQSKTSPLHYDTENMMRRTWKSHHYITTREKKLWEPLENLIIILWHGGIMKTTWKPHVTLWHGRITRTNRKPHHYMGELWELVENLTITLWHGEYNEKDLKTSSLY